MPAWNDIKSTIVDNLGLFVFWYLSLLRYLPFVTFFSLTVASIYIFKRLKYRDKISTKPYTLGRLSAVFFLTVAATYIGVNVYDLIIIIYMDHSIPREDAVARLRFLLRPDHIAIESFIKYFFITVSPTLLIRKMKDRDIWSSIYAPLKTSRRKAVLLGAAYTVSYLFIVFAVSYLIVQTSYVLPERKEIMTVANVTRALYASSPFLALLFPAVIIPMAAIGEEQLFRGIIYTYIRELVGVKYSLVVSAMLFAVYHEISFFTFFYFLAGILLARLYEKTGSIYPSIIVHATILTISLLLGLIF